MKKVSTLFQSYVLLLLIALIGVRANADEACTANYISNAGFIRAAMSSDQETAMALKNKDIISISAERKNLSALITIRHNDGSVLRLETQQTCDGGISVADADQFVCKQLVDCTPGSPDSNNNYCGDPYQQWADKICQQKPFFAQ